MGLLSRLKEKLGISADPKGTELASETEPIHTVSFSIGESLGDVKVAVMHLKTQLQRIEGSMLSKEYFEQSTENRDKSNLIISKLDETLGVLAEFQPRKTSIEPSIPSTEQRIPSSTEERETHLDRAAMSLRLQEVLDIFQSRKRTTPKQLAKLLDIATNTACEHLRTLERLGYLKRLNRGLYAAVS